MMKQTIIYISKLWVTTFGISYGCGLAWTFYALSKPDHPKEWLGVFPTTLFVLALSVLFLPVWVILGFSLNLIIKRVVGKWKQKVFFSLVATVLIMFTSLLLDISITNDNTYLEIGAFYLVSMLISIMLFKPISKPVITNDVPSDDLLQ